MKRHSNYNTCPLILFVGERGICVNITKLIAKHVFHGIKSCASKTVRNKLIFVTNNREYYHLNTYEEFSIANRYAHDDK